MLLFVFSSMLLQVSNGDLAEAVAFLTEKNAKVPQQDETTYYQTSQVSNDRYISVGSQADTSEDPQHFCAAEPPAAAAFQTPPCLCSAADVIDLTGDDKDDLQRAIALSLEESNRAFRETGITDEEQAISRWEASRHSEVFTALRSTTLPSSS